MASNFTLVAESRAACPKADFAPMAQVILGKRYRLTLVLTTAARMKKLNLIYRDKKKPTDILSFPLHHNEGEIYMSASETKKEARSRGERYEKFFIYLFIHGLLHLKGYDHGATMEALEMKWGKRFGV